MNKKIFKKLEEQADLAKIKNSAVITPEFEQAFIFENLNIFGILEEDEDKKEEIKIKPEEKEDPEKLYAKQFDELLNSDDAKELRKYLSEINGNRKSELRELAKKLYNKLKKELEVLNSNDLYVGIKKRKFDFDTDETRSLLK